MMDDYTWGDRYPDMFSTVWSLKLVTFADLGLPKKRKKGKKHGPGKNKRRNLREGRTRAGTRP